MVTKTTFGFLQADDYQRLGARQIRLLRVTRWGLGDMDFRFALDLISLDQPIPPYLAISYTWGLGTVVRLYDESGDFPDV
jgi:hypothetical protein